MDDNYKTMRIRVTFGKTAHMRYTSHLDLHRTWERTLRRARLPLTYSQGFKPRPQLNLAAALPLGFTSQCEIVEFWLDADLTLEQIEAELRNALPPGLQLVSMESIPPRDPKLPALVESAEYIAILLDPVPELDKRTADLLAAVEIQRVRRKKPYDLRPLVEKLEVLAPNAQGQQRLGMHLAAREGATGRPEEVLDELGIDPLSARVQRTELYIREPAE